MLLGKIKCMALARRPQDLRQQPHVQTYGMSRKISEGYLYIGRDPMLDNIRPHKYVERQCEMCKFPTSDTPKPDRGSL